MRPIFLDSREGMRNNMCLLSREVIDADPSSICRSSPRGAYELNAVVAMVERDEHVAYFASAVPLFIHRADDPVGRRVAAGQMIELGLARQDEVSTALHVHRTTCPAPRRGRFPARASRLPAATAPAATALPVRPGARYTPATLAMCRLG
jgi:hypothetical protein